MIAALVVCALAFPLMRAYALRAERSDASPVEKVHRLRRANMVYALLSLPAFALAFLELPYDKRVLGAAAPFVLSLGIPVVVIGSALAAYLGIRPAYERLRGLRAPTTKHAPRRFTRALLVMLVPQLVWLGAVVVLLRIHAHPGFLVAAFIAFIVMVGVSGPYMVRAAMRTREPSPADAQRLAGMFAAHGVAIRGLRVIDTSHDPTANALFSGFGPGAKYVFVTDRLLETFDDDELAAILAHEIGHRKGHHIAIKLGAHLGTVVLLGLLLWGVISIAGDRLPALVPAVVIPVVAISMALLTQGTLGLRLERAADDYAASSVGAAPLRDALEKVAELNMLKRRTGWLWNVLQQHPGLDSRIERLSAAAEGSQPANR